MYIVNVRDFCVLKGSKIEKALRDILSQQSGISRRVLEKWSQQLEHIQILKWKGTKYPGEYILFCKCSLLPSQKCILKSCLKERVNLNDDWVMNIKTELCKLV